LSAKSKIKHNVAGKVEYSTIKSLYSNLFGRFLVWRSVIVYMSVSIHIKTQKLKKILTRMETPSIGTGITLCGCYTYSLNGVCNSSCCGNSNLEFPDFCVLKIST